jgi:two-component system cell cycle sensor histidine kinase/response regulator CckA
VTARILVRRRAAEQAVARAAETFLAVADSLPVTLLIHRGGAVKYLNPTGRAFLAAGGDDLDGRPLSDLIVPGQLDPSVADGSGLAERTLELGDGRVVDVELATLPVQFGGVDATALVMLDLTERRRLLDRLVLADRLAALGTMAAGVAHEINNPLAVVVSNAEVVRDMLADLGDRPMTAEVRSEIGEALADVLDGGHRVARIVKDLRSLSRGEGESLGPVDLEHTISKALQMVGGQLRLRAQVVRRSSGATNVIGNEPRLVQVFVNLLVNAVQALPDGHAHEHTIEVSTRRDPSGEVVATVSDTGCGIPAAVRARIFDPFFTTKAVGVGTGLGLSIVHNMIRQMKGRIEVTSVEAAGTTFSIRLPAAAAPVAAPALAAPAGGGVDRSRILVIDDEPQVCEAVLRLLSATHEVITLRSGRTALDRMAGGERYDLILCDLRMPDMSGAELAQRVGCEFPDLRTRMMFMTGDAEDALRAGLSPMLEKPFTRHDLGDFIARHQAEVGR